MALAQCFIQASVQNANLSLLVHTTQDNFLVIELVSWQHCACMRILVNTCQGFAFSLRGLASLAILTYIPLHNKDGFFFCAETWQSYVSIITKQGKRIWWWVALPTKIDVGCPLQLCKAFRWLGPILFLSWSNNNCDPCLSLGKGDFPVLYGEKKDLLWDLTPVVATWWL